MRICAIVTSTRRFIELLNCIRGIKCQNTKIDKTYIIAREYSNSELEWISKECGTDNNIELITDKNYSNQLNNYFSLFLDDCTLFSKYDYFIAMDDDDFYTSNYFTECKEFISNNMSLAYSHATNVATYYTVASKFGAPVVAACGSKILSSNFLNKFLTAYTDGKIKTVVGGRILFEDRLLVEYAQEQNDMFIMHNSKSHIYVRHDKNISKIDYLP